MSKKCILPWIHLQVDSDGSVRPCCNSNKSSEPLGNLLNDNVVDIWNNSRYIKLRNEMSEGIEPVECKPCYDSERMGLLSKRIRENNDWIQYAHLMDKSTAEFKIRHLDVRFDNVCNYKCRYCSPWLSHSWYNDYIKLGIPVRTEQAINVNGEKLFDIIKHSVIDDLESVFFCGGEPLLMDQHLELLQLLDAKEKYDTKLLYITNLSKLSHKGISYLDMWDKFNDVNVHVSLDITGNKLEYIRHGSKWKTVEANLKTIFERKDKLKPKIGITVSMFNALHVVETVEFLVSTGYINYDDIALHVVSNPNIYSPRILPPNIKEKITIDVNEFLSKHDLPEFFRSRYIYFINHMNSIDLYNTHREQFKEMTTKLDQIRNEDFYNIFTELKDYYD